MRTHYENLKVARNAPIEVIRAAYKSLSQKYHPDRNNGNEENEKIMQIINEAYAVLSDPVRRKEHDDWITSNSTIETTSFGSTLTDATHPSSDYPLDWESYSKKYRIDKERIKHAVSTKKIEGILINGILYLEDKAPYSKLQQLFLKLIPLHWKRYVFGGLLLIIFYNYLEQEDSATKYSRAAQNIPPLPSGFTLDQPSESSATQYKLVQLPPNGESKILINAAAVAPLEINTSGNEHYLVKLKNAATKQDVQTIFIWAGQSVTTDVPLGQYELVYASGSQWYGYKNLFGASTSYSKANKPFSFVQNGNNVSGFTVTLYKVSNGNLRTTKINPAYF